MKRKSGSIAGFIVIAQFDFFLVVFGGFRVTGFESRAQTKPVLSVVYTHLKKGSHFTNTHFPNWEKNPREDVF